MATDRLHRPLDWPGEQRFYLTLDLECDYGTALSDNRYEALVRVGDLVELLEHHDIPLTTFVQTAVLDETPETVEALQDAAISVEFHPHSHTHAARSETSVDEEVRTSTERFREFFGHSPTGYRFPNGNVRPSDYDILSEVGYAFDASVFPSWRPGHFDYAEEPVVPSRLPEHDLYELPFTVFSDRLRVPTSLSYCRLLGRPLRWLLARRPPSSVVFNVHMHDLFNPESYSDLPPLYQVVYARNTDGFEILDSVLRQLRSLGYDFKTISSVNNLLRADT